jgi:hypothetical protein
MGVAGTRQRGPAVAGYADKCSTLAKIADQVPIERVPTQPF